MAGVRFLFGEELEQADGERVGLLSRRAARDPHAERRVIVLVREELGQDTLLERFESGRVTEEGRHVDEDVLRERLGLAGVSAK